MTDMEVMDIIDQSFNEGEENFNAVSEDDVSPIDKDTQKKYTIWKKNTPFLYDYISTNSLVWPSVTVQFLPDLENATSKAEGSERFPSRRSNYEEHDLTLQRLLVGTFTSGMGVDSISIYQLPYFNQLNKNLNIDKLNHNPKKEEFELSSVPKLSLNQLQKINHKGDINRLRYMPQNPDVIASANNLGDLVVYDRTKHSNVLNSISTDINSPQLRLTNPANTVSDIFAMDWNSQKEGLIVSGNMDGEINLYDIKSNYKIKESTNIAASESYLNADIGINDIEWAPNHDSLFYTVDDSGFIKLFDTRLSSHDMVVLSHQQSESGINTIGVNIANPVCLATGDVDGFTNVWDIRTFNDKTANSVYKIKSHEDSITQLKWHPKYHNVLGTSSTDRSVNLFDIGEHSVDTNNTGLFFTHRGHMLGVNDFDWSLHDDWLAASVADDNSLHVWKPASHIVQKYSNS